MRSRRILDAPTSKLPQPDRIQQSEPQTNTIQPNRSGARGGPETMRCSKNPTAATTPAAALVGLLLLASSSATKAKSDGVFFSDSFEKHPVGKAPPAPWATTVSKGASVVSISRDLT